MISRCLRLTPAKFLKDIFQIHVIRLGSFALLAGRLEPHGHFSAWFGHFIDRHPPSHMFCHKHLNVY